MIPTEVKILLLSVVFASGYWLGIRDAYNEDKYKTAQQTFNNTEIITTNAFQLAQNSHEKGCMELVDWVVSQTGHPRYEFATLMIRCREDALVWRGELDQHFNRPSLFEKQGQ